MSTGHWPSVWVCGGGGNPSFEDFDGVSSLSQSHTQSQSSERLYRLRALSCPLLSVYTETFMRELPYFGHREPVQQSDKRHIVCDDIIGF